MATLTELSQRLFKRFKGVPNITIEDATDWTEEAMLEHGYSSNGTVPSDKESLILLYAQYEGARQISISTAHYFTYTDAEEQVDKTMVSEQYRKLSLDLKAEYDGKKSSVSGSKFRGLVRGDR